MPNVNPSQPASPPALDAIRGAYPAIRAIVSPPRCSSTAFARVFWEHSSVGFYSHEPFEVTYYEGAGLDAVAAKLAAPLALERIKCLGGRQGEALVIKEMPYQVGDAFHHLVALATPPLIFLMRDPRSSVASRMAKKREVGDEPIFPEVETGWELLNAQIDWCRSEGIDHLLVDSRDWRRRPYEVLPEVFERCGLGFDPAMLRWRACPEVELDNLGGRHRHLYGQVLASTGIVADSAPIPSLESFPEERGWRDHVARCLEIYRALSARPERLGVGEPVVAG